jgi:hypothetical protein
MGTWKASKEEFRAIIYGSLVKPKYIYLHLRESIKATAQQLTCFDIGDGNGSFLQGTKLHERISAFVPHELVRYSNSVQNKSDLSSLAIPNKLFRVIVLFSILVLCYTSISKKITISSSFQLVGVLVLFSLVLNAWVCGTFANAIDRLGSKMIWLIPFLALLRIASIFERKEVEAEIDSKAQGIRT